MAHSQLHAMADVDMNEVLSQFIAEVRKENAGRYPRKTLHELMISLQKYFELKGRKVNFYSSRESEKLRKSVDY